MWDLESVVLTYFCTAKFNLIHKSNIGTEYNVLYEQKCVGFPFSFGQVFVSHIVSQGGLQFYLSEIGRHYTDQFKLK